MPNQRTVAIIQARLNSERLPGKILADIEGQSMLERVIRRVQMAKKLDETVLATTDRPADDVTAAKGEELGVRVVRGSEDDVLDRYRQAAIEARADHIVRVSADSPFVDAQLIDQTVDVYTRAGSDYASNKLHPSFPLGLDVEIFSRAALERAWKEAKEPFERSHVTYYMYSNPSRFSLVPVTTKPDRHTWRWTVDTPDDLEFARTVFEKLGSSNDFSWKDVVLLLTSEPDIANINSHITAKPVTEG
jgi:spore coat polysaccharide biosynthesis protein SpsF (cytidylyltransferase family)